MVLLSELPDDVVLYLLRWVPHAERGRLALVCRRWARLMHSHSAWSGPLVVGGGEEVVRNLGKYAAIVVFTPRNSLSLGQIPPYGAIRELRCSFLYTARRVTAADVQKCGLGASKSSAATSTRNTSQLERPPSCVIAATPPVLASVEVLETVAHLGDVRWDYAELRSARHNPASGMYFTFQGSQMFGMPPTRGLAELGRTFPNLRHLRLRGVRWEFDQGTTMHGIDEDMATLYDREVKESHLDAAKIDSLWKTFRHLEVLELEEPEEFFLPEGTRYTRGNTASVTTWAWRLLSRPVSVQAEAAAADAREAAADAREAAADAREAAADAREAAADAREAR